MKIYGNVDLEEGNKITNLTVAYGTSDPANPNNAELFFRTDTNKLRVYYNSVWNDVAAGAGAGTGSVTSVDLSVPSFLSVSGNPITTSGTLAVTLATQTANLVFAGPSSGGAVTPTFRSLVALDIPSLDWSKITTGKPTTLSGYGITDGQPLATNLTTLSSNGTANQIAGMNSGATGFEYKTVSAGNGTTVTHGANSISIALPNVGTPVSSSFVKITTDTQGRVSATTSVGSSDITGLVDSVYVNVGGDSMSSGQSLTFSGGGTATGLPNPTNSSDAANKAYVDQLVAASATWRNPIVDSDLYDLVSSNPGSPVAGTTYIATAAFSFTGFGTYAASVGDIVTLNATTNLWTFIKALATGDRFLITAEHGTGVGATLGGITISGHAVVQNDLIQYAGGTITSSSSWTLPEGHAGTSPTIPQGTTVLANSPLGEHYGHTYLFNSTGTGSWIEIAGPGAVGAGVGLVYSGNTLNINLGAGIAQLPTDEVGLDLWTQSSGSLFFTSDGSTRDNPGVSASKLHLLLDGSTLSQSATGLKVSEANVTHNNLGGLTTGDPHTQYALLAGRSGGQTIYGGTAASNNLTIDSTSNVTKGNIALQPSGGGVTAGGTLSATGNITSAGRLGVGTSSPTSQRITAYDSGGSGDNVILSQSSAGAQIYMQANANSIGTFGTLSNHPLQVMTNNTERLRISSTGIVAIGNTANFSNDTLSVMGTDVAGATSDATIYARTVATSGAAGTGSGIGFGTHSGAGGGEIYAAVIKGIKENGTAANTATAMTFATRANGGAITEYMRIASSGAVGIGVVPSAWGGGLKAIDMNTHSAFVGGISGPSIEGNLYYDGTNWKYKTSNYATEIFLNNTNGVISFSNTSAAGTAGANATTTERMRIDSSGNVGIGVTPVNKLDVAGTSRLQFSVGNSYTNLISTNAANSAYARLYFTASDYFWQTATGDKLYLDANGNVGIGVTPTAGNGVLQISNGIAFPATQSAIANANTLDDYEEGTFTPTIIGESTAGTGTYSAQVGRYTKIGNRVLVQIHLVWSAHTGAGKMDIGGLPFTAAVTTGVCALHCANMTITGQLFGLINTTSLILYAVNNGAQTQLDLDTAAEINGVFHYDV